MSSLLWTTDLFGNAGSPPTGFHSYNNDTGIWTGYTGWPDAVIGSLDSSMRCQGAWDGTYWYVIGTDAKLYRMDGTAHTWSAALVGGTPLITLVANNFSTHGWVMTSDGRFVYILIDGSDFRRYDPVADTLTTLPPPTTGGTVVTKRAFLAFDGVDTIYANKAASGSLLKFSISSGTWSAVGTFAQGGADNWAGAVCLQGKLWLFSYDGGGSNSLIVTQYNPGNSTWTAKTSQVIAGVTGGMPYAEDTDFTIRFWRSNSTSYIYNVGTDSWTTSSGSPVDLSANNGANWAVTRLFSPAYSFFQADGVTPLAPNFAQGSAVIGQTITTQIKVKTPVTVGGGATVAVVSNVQTDADDVVTVSATANGSYTSSFVTGALTAGQLFDVFIKVVPSSAQTAGLPKNWNLRAT